MTVGLILWFSLTFFTKFVASESEKRLLLNDNDLLDQRLNQLERTVQVLSSTVQQQTAKIDQHAATIAQQTATIDKLQLHLTSIGNSAGSTYIRWGKTSCPNNTELVYSGYVGGGYFTSYGSAADYVCLTHEAILGRYSSTSNAEMYGGEYELGFDGIHEQDAPCSVCLNKNAQSSMMIPGRNLCYSGWNMEYHGVLAAGYPGHQAASTFICVDQFPDIVDGGAANQEGKLLYTVVGKCGSLKCPPYKQDYEITCVVCSK